MSVARSAPPKLFSAGTPLGRGGRLDAHEQHPYLGVRLACEVAVFTPPKLFSAGTPSCRDFQARAQNARGESLALRRVVPSPKKRHRAQARPLSVYVKRLRISDVRTSPKECASYSNTLRISVRCKCSTPTNPISEKLYSGRSCTSTLILSRSCAEKFCTAKPAKFFAPLTTTSS